VMAARGRKKVQAPPPTVMAARHGQSVQQIEEVVHGVCAKVEVVANLLDGYAELDAEVEPSSLYSPVAVLKEARDALVNIEWPDACPHCAPKLSEAAAEGGA